MWHPNKVCCINAWTSHFVIAAVTMILVMNSAASAQNGDERKWQAIDRFAHMGPLFARGKHSLAEFRLLGPILRERHKEENNPYDSNRKNEFVELVFDGLEIYGRLENKEFLPIRVKITSQKWKVLDGLDVGTNAERIRKTLGMPTKQSPVIEEYCGETECVVFGISAGLISSVEFSYYAD